MKVDFCIWHTRKTMPISTNLKSQKMKQNSFQQEIRYMDIEYAMLSNYESCNWWWIYGFDNKGKLYIMPLKSTVL